MAKRFDNAGLVLGAAQGRAAALCRFVGHPDGADSPAVLEVVRAVLDFAEQLPGVVKSTPLRLAGRRLVKRLVTTNGTSGRSTWCRAM